MSGSYLRWLLVVTVLAITAGCVALIVIYGAP